MNVRILINRVFLLFATAGLLSTKVSFGQDTGKPKEVVKERLPVSFGTIVKMQVEIVDGDEFNNSKCYPDFLFRIKTVDSMLLSTSVIIDFKDESGNNFPSDVFKLYKNLYGKDTGMISSEVKMRMKKEYVGKVFNIDGYETGQFTGIPNGLTKYRVPPQGCGFYFRHCIVVLRKR